MRNKERTTAQQTAKLIQIYTTQKIIIIFQFHMFYRKNAAKHMPE
jgi:hypothetical protein